jgi:hypothetical protein
MCKPEAAQAELRCHTEHQEQSQLATTVTGSYWVKAHPGVEEGLLSRKIEHKQGRERTAMVLTSP